MKYTEVIQQRCKIEQLYISFWQNVEIKQMMAWIRLKTTFCILIMRYKLANSFHESHIINFAITINNIL